MFRLPSVKQVRQTMKLSYSRLSVFLDCPKRFLIQYMGAERYNETTDALDTGKAFHWAVENTVKEMIEAGVTGRVEVPKDRVLQLFNGCDIEETGPMSLYAHSDGVEIIRSMTLMVDPSKVAYVEGDFEEAIPATPHTIGGFIDRVDRLDAETMEVIDYKTGKVLVQAENNKQLMIYAWALSKRYPEIMRWKLTIEMVRTGESSSWEVETKDLKKIEEWLTYIANRLDAEIAQWREEQEAIAEFGKDEVKQIAFKPVVGANCQWCPFAADCLKDHPLGVPEPMSTNDMIRMVEDYVRLSTMGKRAYSGKYRLLSKIEAAVMRSDVSEFDTSVGRYVIDSGMTFNLTEVVDVFKAHGRKISPFLKLDDWKLKREAEKDTELGRALREVSRPKIDLKLIETE